MESTSNFGVKAAVSPPDLTIREAIAEIRPIFESIKENSLNLRRNRGIDEDFKKLFETVATVFSDTDISTKTFANLHDGALIANTDYEGDSFQNAAVLLEKTLRVLLESKCLSVDRDLDDLMKDLTDVKRIGAEIEKVKESFSTIITYDGRINAIAALSQAIEKEVKDLPPGGNIVIPAGWTGDPGHAMLVNITRELEGGGFTLTIVNTGGGLEYHPQIEVENTTKQFPFLTFKGIPEELLSEDYFFSVISKQILKPPLKTYLPSEIYLSLCAPFSAYRIDEKLDFSSFIKGQRSGTCTSKVLLALLKLRIKEKGGERNTYKRFVFFIKWITAIAFYQKQKDICTKKEDPARTLLKEALKNLMTMNSKGLRKGLLHDEEVKSACLMVARMQNHLRSFERSVKKEPCSFAKVDKISPFDFGCANEANVKTDDIRSDSFLTFDEITPANFEKASKSAYKKALEFRNRIGIEGAKKQIENFVDKLKLDESLCVGSKEDVKKRMKQLVSFQNLYVSFFQAQESFCLTSEQNTILTLFSVTHKLCTHLENELAKIDPNTPRASKDYLFEIIKRDDWSKPSLLFFSKEDYEKRCELIKFLNDSTDFRLPVTTEITFNLGTVTNGNYINNHTKQIKNHYKEDLDNHFKNKKRLNWEKSVSDYIWPFAELYTDYGDDPSTSFYHYMGWEHLLLLKKAAVFTMSCLESSFRLKVNTVQNREYQLEEPQCVLNHRLKLLETADSFGAIEIKVELEDPILNRHRHLENYVDYKDNSAIHFIEARNIVSRFPDKKLTDRDLQRISFLKNQFSSGSLSEVDYVGGSLSVFQASEPTLRPIQMLGFFKENQSLLEKRKFQNFFIEQFFKATVIETERLPPFHKEGWDTREFKDAFLDFIREGKKTYLSFDGKSKIPTLLFFMKVTRMLFPYFDKEDEFFIALQKEMSLLETLLMDSSFSKSDRALIHIERILYYKALPHLEERYIRDIIESYFYFVSSSIELENFERHEHRHVRKFVYQVLQKQINLSFLAPSINGMIEKTGVSVPFACKAEQDNDCPHLFHVTDENGKPIYSVNLITAEVLKQGEGILSFDVNPAEFYENSNFQELFGSKRFDFYRIGDFIHFQIGKDEFRFLRKDTKLASIEWKMTSEWVQFKPRKELLKINQPLALIADHHTFVFGLNRFITDSDFNLKYVVNSEGDVFFASLDKEIRHFTAHEDKLHFIKPNSFLANFEKEEYIYIEKIGNQEILTFPRFSHQGKPLRFIKNQDSGLFLYEFDTRYHLAETQKVGLLENFKNYLLLSSGRGEDEKNIVLIPDTPYTKNDKLIVDLVGGTPLDIKDLNLQLINEKEVQRKQSLSKEYFALPIVNGQLGVRKDEEILFAAYLALGQRQYKKAMKLLKRVTPSLFLSEKALELLNRIISLPSIPEKKKDETVYATAIQLKAIYILNKIKSLKGEKADLEYKPLLRRYLSQISRVPKKLRLSIKEEKELLDLEGFDERKKYLKTKIKEGNTIAYDLRSSYGTSLSINIPYSLDELDNRDDVPFDKLSLSYLYSCGGNIRSRSAFCKIYDHIVDSYRYTQIEKENLRMMLINSYLFATRDSQNKQAAFLLFLYEFVQKNNKPPFDNFDTWSKKQVNANKKITDWMKDVKTYYGCDQTEICIEVGPFARFEMNDQENSVTVDHNEFPIEKSEEAFPLFNIEAVDEKISHVQEQAQKIDEVKERSIDQNIRILSQSLEERTKGKDLENVRGPILSSLNDFNEGYASARLRRQEAKIAEISDSEIQDHKLKLNEVAKRIEERLHERRDRLLLFVNELTFTDQKMQLEYEADLLAGNRKEVVFADLINLFVRPDKEFYQGVIPQLRDYPDAIQFIFDKTAEVLYLGVQLNHIRHLVSALTKVELTKSEEKQAALKELSLVAKQEKNMSTYQKRPSLLAFEYTRNIILRKEPDQLGAILHLEREEEGKYKDSILQMEMGGGKTSVVIGNLLAEKKGIPILITPAFQYHTIYQSVKKTLEECFNMGVETFNYTRNELTVPILKNIENTLREILESSNQMNRKALIVCPEMLQILELELISTLDKMADEHLEKVETLVNILKLFREHGNAIGDEIQTLFDINKEVNFSLGEPKALKEEYLDLTREVFAIISTKDIPVPKKYRGELSHVDFTDIVEDNDSYIIPIEKLLNLSKNRQKYVSTQFYKECIAPGIANILAKEYRPFNLSESDKEKFSLYVTNEMDVERDAEFVDNLKARVESNNEKVQLEANLIALTKHLLTDVLSSTFTQEGNVRYGRTSDPKMQGKVNPFLCAATESTTEFAYHYEAAAFHFATALHYGVTREQIRTLADSFHRDAMMLLDAYPSYEKTPPALLFNEIFMCLPNEIETKEEIFFKELSENKRKLLEIEALTVQKFVRYYPRRISSNAHTLFSMFKSFTAMGGTIDPYVLPLPMQEQRAKQLSLNIELDSEKVALDGLINPEIVHEVLSKSKDSSLVIIDVEKSGSDVQNLLYDMIKGQEDPQKISSILDAGGLFKDYHPEEIASSLLNVLDQKGVVKEGVLFFSRKAGEGVANHFTLMKRGTKELIVLQDTSDEELKKYGLTSFDCISFYDQRHCLGTDIKQPRNGLGLLTVDKGVSLDGICQAIMRLREFLLGQEVAIILPKQAAQRTPSVLGGSVKDLLEGNEPDRVQKGLISLFGEILLMQAQDRAKDLYRSYQRAIFNTLYQSGLKRIIEANPEGQAVDKCLGLEMCRILNNFKSAIFLSTEDTPFKSFGSLSNRELAIEELKTIADKSLKSLKSAIPEGEEKDEIMRECEANLKAILDFATKVKDRMIHKISTLSPSSMGSVLEVAREEQTDTTLELNLSQELQRELESYQSIWDPKPKEYQPWIDEEMNKLLSDVTHDNKYHLNNILPVIKIGRSYIQEIRYQGVFDENLFVSSTACNPFTVDENDRESVNIFDRRRPPLNHLLYIKERREGIILSQSEGAQFKQYLEKNPCPGVLLVLNSEDVIVGERIDPEDATLRRLLLQLNVLNANTHYLVKHSREYLTWMLEGKTTEKCNFLKLKAESRPLEKQVLYKHLFQFAKLHELHAMEDAIEKKRIGNKLKEEDIPTLENHLVPVIPNQLVPFVKESQVPFLLNEQIPYLDKKEQVDAVLDDKLQYLEPSQVALLNDEKKIKFLRQEPKIIRSINPSIFARLSIEDLDETNYIIRYASEQQYLEIRSPDVIKRIPQNKWVHIHPSMVSSFDAEKVLDIVTCFQDKPSHLANLSKEQIERLGIQDKSLIRKLPISLFDYFSKEQRNELSKDQIEGLSQQQIQSLDDNQLKDLSLLQVQKFPVELAGKITKLDRRVLNDLPISVWKRVSDKNMLMQITKEEVIHELGTQQIKFLADHQLRLLSKDQVVGIDPAQEKELFEHLPKELFGFIPDDRVQNLTEAQVRQFPPALAHRVELLNNSILDNLPLPLIRTIKAVDKLRALKTKEAIQSLEQKDQIRSLKDEQLVHLSKDQIRLFSGDEVFIKRLPASQFANIWDRDLKYLSEAQVKAFPKELVSKVKWLNRAFIDSLPSEVIKLVEDDDILRSFKKKETLQVLEKKQIHRLNVDQIEQLLPTQIQEIDNPYVLNKLKTSTFKNCTDEQLRKLDVFQVEQFPKELAARAKAIKPSLFNSLPEEVIHEVRDDSLQNLSKKEKIQILDKEQIRHLAQRQIHFLSKEQVRLFKGKEDVDVIHRFTDNLFEHLEEDQLPLLSEDQVKQYELKTKKVIEVPEEAQIKPLPVDNVQIEKELAKTPEAPTTTSSKPEVKPITLLSARPEQMRFMSGPRKIAYIVSTLVFPILSLLLAIPIILIRLPGKICHLNLLQSATSFSYQNMIRVAQLSRYLVCCCKP